jgi:prepilin-type N-terminal cleavage/methylation domain-containing protein
MKRRGFTIVELVVVMTIMAILLGLGIFGLQKSQANARDAERRSDVEAMMRGLEERYKNGNPIAYYDGGTGLPKDIGWDQAGQYPGVNEIFHVGGWNKPGWFRYMGGGDKPYWEEVFAGVSASSFTSPTGQSIGLDCVYGCDPAGTMSQILDGKKMDGTAVGTGVNSGAYVYEPVDKDGKVCCCKGCVRYDIYYKDEAGTLIKVSSQNQ